MIFSLVNPLFASAETSTDQLTKKLNVDKRISKLKESMKQRERQLANAPMIDSSLEKIKGDKKVDVIVQLTEVPVAFEKGKNIIQGKSLSSAKSTNLKKKVISEQARFEKLLKMEKISFKKGFTYNQAFNGMSLTVKADDIEKLANIKGVVSVHPVEEVHALEVNNDDTMTPNMVDSVPHLDIPALWEKGVEGEGVKVAVLDTGIDYEHPDLKDVYKGGYNFIPHNSDYARDRADDDPYETTPEDKPEHMPEFLPTGQSFYTSHGTHVAGTIAAQGTTEHGIKGIAPKVELYAYRVLGAYGSGATDGIMAAIEKSIEEDMDIINLSLGGGSNSQNAPDAIAINNATIAGITAVVATGNSGPGRGTIGNPATAPLAISVGNSTLPEVTLQSTVAVEAGDYSNESDVNLMAWTYGSNPKDALTGEYDVVAIPGVGNPNDFKDLDVDGKVALISRGEIPFVDKIAAAKEAGAVATIIHNNEGEGPANVSLSTAFDYIPTFDMATSEGEALREALEKADNQTGKVIFSNYKESQTAGDEINDTSSRGPSTPNFDIKPDVSAPGTNIMSTVPAYGKDNPDANYEHAYDRFTGTSMATPHVAGVAALLLSKNPDWTPFDVKVAMSNTAKQLDTNKYDVFAQGPGLVQPLKAANAGALAYALDTTVSGSEEVEHEKGTVTFGRVEANPEKQQTISKQIVVRSMNGQSDNFDVNVDVIKAGTGDMADASVSVDKSSFTLNGTETLDVTLAIPAGEGAPGNELLGYIQITGGKTEMLLPFAAEFSGASTEDPSGLEYFELQDYVISPNADGKFDETELHLGLSQDEDLMSIELWDAANPFGGEFGDGYIGLLALQSLTAGDYILPIDGTYVDWGTEEETDIPEGVYTIDYNSWDLSGGTIENLAYDGPFFVKTSQSDVSFAEIEDEIEGAEYEITGAIDDKFIDFKSTVEDVFGVEYDINDYLEVGYELKDENNEVAEKEAVVLEQDGAFAISLSDLTTGDYTLILSVNDIAANAVQEEVELKISNEPEDPEEPEEPEVPEEFTIFLSKSTKEPTEGPVTVTVETDSKSELKELKWLEGEKSVEDFAEAGSDIDIEAMSFDISENGVYTVYAKNSDDVEAVQTIEITNIIDSVPAEFTVSLSKSTEEPTEGPVTVTVETDSEPDLVELKWLEGEKATEDFSGAGNTIDLDTMSFDISKNGIYTVYAKNSDDVEAIQTVDVTNILDPDQGDIDFSLELSTKEPTEDPVTVTVQTDEELVALKWLEGGKTIEDFAEGGHGIDLETKSFEIDENGMYTVYAENSDGEKGVISITIRNITDSAQEEINVTLTPSVTDETEGPVAITVETDSESELVEMKWLEGEKAAKDFSNAGNNIDFDSKSFNVAENGIYTVYVKNSDGVEAVQTIEVTNIVDPVQEEINVTLTPSTTDKTEDPVTVTVETDSESELVELKWLEGEKSTKDFTDAGTDIDLDSKSFNVGKNGTYTVYAKNSDGVEAVQMITISNITEPDQEQPGDDDEEEQPDDEDKGDGDKEQPGDEDKDDGDREQPGDENKGDGNKGQPGDENKDGAADDDQVGNDVTESTDNGEKLPNTATSTYNHLVLGAILVMVGLLAAYIQYRKKQKMNM